MIVQALIGYLAPKVTQYLFSHLDDWAGDIARGVGCKVLNFAGEKYAEQRKEIENWVRNVIPGERWDELAVKAVDNLIVFAMQEVAEFIECEIKLHGLNGVDALKRAAESAQIPAVFERISEKVKQDAVMVYKNF